MTLSVNCLVLGDDPDQIFTVEIQEKKTVSILKDMIKEKNSFSLGNVDAKDINIWKVNIRLSNAKAELIDLELDRNSKLTPGKKLSSIFNVVDDECLHIIAKAPIISPAVALYSTQFLSLNCFLLGETLGENEFTVEVPKTKNVSILKDMIKEKKAHFLDHVDASVLELWNVSMFEHDHIENWLKNPEAKPLGSLLPLLQVFPGPIKSHEVHIGVRAPIHTRRVSKDRAEDETRDNITGLNKRFQNTITNIKNASAPADSAKSQNYSKSQILYSIQDGRYPTEKLRTTVAPPIQLFHSVFGHFLDDAKRDGPIPEDVILLTAKYMTEASAVFRDEKERLNKLQPLLCQILGVNINTIENEDKTRPDGLVEIMITLLLRFVILVMEGKNEFGDGGSDPSTQAGLSAARCWVQDKYKAHREATNCPTFLIAIAGPWVAILGAVITDDVIVQRLTDFIWVGFDSVLNESRITAVARMFYALKLGLERLKRYYEHLPTSLSASPKRFFPYITAYPQNGKNIDFDYVGYLENTPDCTTFRARAKTVPVRDIVVKFVDRYGQQVHALLADAGLAPKLFYCGPMHLNDEDPSYSSLSMVVMDYVDGDTLANAVGQMASETREKVRSEVRRALGLLDIRGFVFGDLRRPNVMITKNKEVRLIDFNWAGVQGQVKYPCVMNSRINWANGVQPLGDIENRHDLEMLDKLF